MVRSRQYIHVHILFIVCSKNIGTYAVGVYIKFRGREREAIGEQHHMLKGMHIGHVTM